MTKSNFKEILLKIHFSDTDTADSNDEGNKVRPLIDQSIDDHMVKFKGRSSMKQCIKS